MSLLFAAILGLVQGVAEFLPISSSGHLAILQNFFNIKEADLLFDVLLHFATLIAIVIVYWKDIVEMIKQVIGFFKDINHPKPESGAPNPARRLVLMLIIVPQTIKSIQEIASNIVVYLNNANNAINDLLSKSSTEHTLSEETRTMIENTINGITNWLKNCVPSRHRFYRITNALPVSTGGAFVNVLVA